MRLAFQFGLFVVMSGASQATDQSVAEIRYVAVGDSYSIGQGASPSESWPAVLTRNLKSEGFGIELVANPSQTGWTTQDAIDRELPIFLKAKPDFATLQIGVNDWVQAVDEAAFRKNFTFLLDRMLGVLSNKKR